MNATAPAFQRDDALLLERRLSEKERVDSGYHGTLPVRSVRVMYPIFAGFSPDEQKRRHPPRPRNGEWIGCFGLNGPKTWMTNAPTSDASVVRCRAQAGLSASGVG